MSIRSKGFWLFTLLVSFLVMGAATAYACHEPALGSFPGGYRAGETVTFSVSGAQTDATYSLRVEGHHDNVAQGTVTRDGGFSSTFTMPDLGSGGTYYAYLEITHEGHSGSGSWPSSQQIRFEAPAPGSGEDSSDAQQQDQQGQKRSQQDGSEQRPQTDGSPVGARDEATQLQPAASSPALSQAQQAQRARSAKTAQRSNKAADGAVGTDVAAGTEMKRPATTPLTQPMVLVGTHVSDLTEADGRGTAAEVFDGLIDDTFASSAGDAEATESGGIDVFLPAAAAAAMTLLLLLGARRPRPPARVIALPRPRSNDLVEDRAA